jgi:DNA mismatch repair ATPase MutS
MLNIRTHLFGENDSKIEYLTFEYLFEEVANNLNSSLNNNSNNVDNENEIHAKKLIFLYKIKQGITKSSFAINIAERAGLPNKITKRANQLLKLFEENDDQDEDILNEKKEPEEKFSLLNTPESLADINR